MLKKPETALLDKPSHFNNNLKSIKTSNLNLIKFL